MANENMVVTAAIGEDRALFEARLALAGAARKTGEVVSTYAQNITRAFGAAWWMLKGKARQGLNAERAAFVVAMVAEGFGKPTIDVYWQRVKESAGYKTAGNRASGSVETVDSKTLAELKTILNRIFKAEEGDSEEGHELSSEAKGALMAVYSEMGGDLDKIGAK